MNPIAIVSLVLVGVGILLILLGAWLSLAEWKRANPAAIAARDLGETLTGLARLLDALKDYPVGRQLIVLGIVILIIAGIFGGVSGLR